MLVAALVLVLGGCGVSDPVAKSRTDSMRGAAWPGQAAEDVTLGSAAVVHTGTPSPTATPSPFGGVFEPPDGAEATEDEPTADASRTVWPVPTPDAPYEELEHTPEPDPDPDPDPCDAVGVVPDECDPEPDPTPCADSGPGCEPTDCEQGGSDGCDPPDCDGGPTSEPSAPPDASGSPEPTGTPGASQTPTPGTTQSPSPTASPSPSDPPDDDEPGC